MTALFTTFFRQQLFTTPTLMNSASVSVAYFTQYASFTDPYDPSYADVRTLDDLQAKLGWGVPLVPYTVPTAVFTRKPGNSIYVIASNHMVNGAQWSDSPVAAAAFFIDTTVSGPIAVVTNPIIFITSTPFSGKVFRQADALTSVPDITDLGTNDNTSIFSWQEPAAGAPQVFPIEGPLVVSSAPPNYESSHLEHVWLFPQRVNMLANPSFEHALDDGTVNHWKTNGTLTRVNPPRDPLVWEGHVHGTGSIMFQAPFWLKAGETATTPNQLLDVPFTIKAHISLPDITATTDLFKHGASSPDLSWRIYFQGGALRLALSYDGISEDTAADPVFTATELSTIAINDGDFYIGVEISSLRDSVVYRGMTSTDGTTWTFNNPKSYVQVNPVHSSNGVFVVGGSNWTGKLYGVQLERAGSLLWNFDPASGYLATLWQGSQDEEWRASGSAINGTLGRSLILESNLFPTHLADRSGLWTIQLLVRGTGRIRIGMIAWEAGFAQTGADWGPDTDVWTLPNDGYLHLYVMRHVSDASTALVRIECDGPEFYVDNLLCEPEWLPDWPYFDGDTSYGAMGDYSWYGGETLQGQTYSMWYNHRRAVIGRLFAWSISDNDFTVTDTEIEAQGYVYKWVPAGVRVVPHLDVLWIGDVQLPVPAVVGPVTATRALITDVLGVYPAWAINTLGKSFVTYPFPATDLFPNIGLFPDLEGV